MFGIWKYWLVAALFKVLVPSSPYSAASGSAPMPTLSRTMRKIRFLWDVLEFMVYALLFLRWQVGGTALRWSRGGRGEHGAACGFFPSGTPQCTRFRSAPSRSRASPYAKRKGVWRPHASMGRHTPFLFAHCSLPARTLYQQFFDLYSPKAGGRGDFYRQILRLVRKLEDVSCRFVSFILSRGAYVLRQRDFSGFHVLLFRTSWFVRNGHFEFTGLKKRG